MLFFGGNYDKQKVSNIININSGLSKKNPFNDGFMFYRGQLYPILMPCGEVEDEDDRDIDFYNIFE